LAKDGADLTSVPRPRYLKASIAAGGVVLLAGLITIIVLLTGGSSDPYQVRAIFDNAANLTPGEQVKVAGVPVGSVDSVEPTPQAKAAVVMTISNSAFQDFRSDAYCIIRPQSLLGEKFVDCRPTEARAEGTPPPPALSVIPAGKEGAGQRELPVQNTSSPVDVDLLTDINRLPQAQRLRIILNELGVGLAGRGEDLHEVIVRANPALRETNRVLAILANENRILSKLAVDSDRALTPLAAVRKQFADAFVQQNIVATASARHEAALARNLELFPGFLEQLAPAMERVRAFADETIPVFTELGKAAPSINRIFTQLPAFSNASTVYLTSLGKFGKTAGPALKASEPLLERLETLGNSARPFASNLSSLFTNLRSTGGIERFMDFIFLTAGATNGYNSLGHFLRADLTSIALCSIYRTTGSCGNPAKFIGGETTTKATASSLGASGSEASAEGGSQEALQRTLALLESRTQSLPSGGSRASRPGGSAPNASSVGESGSPISGSGAVGSRANRLLLNYLLGE
jgi:phospholipid/cholesterol/gamma-HCH transport system substrate-binding protein